MQASNFAVAQRKLSREDAFELYRYYDQHYANSVHFADWQPHHKNIVLENTNLDQAKKAVDQTFAYHQILFQQREVRINEIISQLHDEYWLFSPNFETQGPNAREALIWDQIALYLKANRVQTAEEVKIHDGAKKTILTKTATYVLKIYPETSQVYDIEKNAYATLERIQADMNDFVRQWGWNDGARIAFAEKMDGTCDKSRSLTESKRIVTKLKLKGYYLTDLIYGDNVGFIGQRAVVFDVKSFKKWVEGAPYDVTKL